MFRGTQRQFGSEPKVLIVPPSYFASDRIIGGGERYAFEYAGALAERTPTTFCLFDRKPSRSTAGRLTLKTLGVKHFDERRAFPITAQSWRALSEYDVIHIMVFPTPLTDLLILSALIRKQKVVLTDVGGGGPCWSTYLQKLNRRANVNRLAHGLALLSKHSATFFTDWSQPQTVLYGGVNLREFNAMESTSKGYALFVGRLLPHKGALPLIQALSPETPLHIVGRPYDEHYLHELHEAAAGKRVRFILDADDAELKRQYLGASVVLQPSLPFDDPEISKSELLGLVTLEAMACGKPVIVTRTDSLPDLVVEGKTGFAVEPYDLAALRSHVELLINNPSLSQTMGRAGRRLVEDKFTWSSVVQRGLDFYCQLYS